MKRTEAVTMTRLAIAAAAIGLVVAGVAFAAGIDGGGDDRLGASTTTTTGTTTTDDRAADFDRREHRAEKAKNAKRVKKARLRDDRNRRGVREPGEDVRGPCDEAEHANDPRCTGAARGDDDNGRGRSGGNSGPG
jgi:hypothetical protein